jgi:hypothetical protein
MSIFTESILLQYEWNEAELELLETLRGIEERQFTIDRGTLDDINAKWPDLEALVSIEIQKPPSSLGKVVGYGILQWIVESTEECIRSMDIETGWNSFVHDNVLSLASKRSVHRGDIGLHNVTTASLKGELVPTSKCEEPQPGANVNFVYTFLCKSMSALSLGRARPALKILSTDRESDRIGDCNAFTFDNTAYEPVSISIVTMRRYRRPELGLVQCAVWLDAQIRWLCRVRALVAANPKSQYERSSIPALPSVGVIGAEWYVQLTKETEDGRTYFWGEEGGGMHIGSTISITGVLQVVNGLMVLIDYAIGVYRPWLTDQLAALPDFNSAEERRSFKLGTLI